MIYILDNSPALSAQYLDDRALSRCIKTIAQVLCEVHHHIHSRKEIPIPLAKIPYVNSINKWSRWARERLANYDWLVKYGEECCKEFTYRSTHKISENGYAVALHELKFVIQWCRRNVPDLRGGQMLCIADMPSSNTMDLRTQFPLVMPKRYLEVNGVTLTDRSIGYHQQRIKAYCNCYIHKLSNKPKWTRRRKPGWLNLNN